MRQSTQEQVECLIPGWRDKPATRSLDSSGAEWLEIPRYRVMEVPLEVSLWSASRSPMPDGAAAWERTGISVQRTGTPVRA